MILVDRSLDLAKTASSRCARLAFLYGITGALASVAVLPYFMTLNASLIARIPASLPLFVTAQFLQSCVMLFVLSWIGLRLGQTIGLGSPLARALVYREPIPFAPQRTLAVACVIGLLAGAAVLVLAKVAAPLMPSATLPAPISISLWKRALACFWGGIGEELITRLFLMTLIVWIVSKIGRNDKPSPAFPVILIGVVGAAIVFGLGHLPAAAAIGPLTPTVVARIVLLNAVAGVPFGLLYWRWGLEHAMCAHFVADIVLHVLGGQ